MGISDKLHNMSIDQIKSMVDILQKASDAYLYILDLTSNVYMIPEKLTKRVALDSWISCKGVAITDSEEHRLPIGKVNELGKKANPDMIQGFLFGKPSSADDFKEKFLVNV